jgi:hypothetical protein
MPPKKRISKKIKTLEKDIKEEKKLWQKIEKIPSEDKGFIALLKKLLRPHKEHPKKSPPQLKSIANKLFWGIEPPQKPKQKPKKR